MNSQTLLLTALIAVTLTGSAHANFPDQPFHEDFLSTTHKDALKTYANWSEENGKVTLGIANASATRFPARGVAIGGQTDRTIGIAVGDLDNDSDLDIVTVNTFGYEHKIYRNRGRGTFTSASIFDEDTSSYQDVALGDIDGDGDGIPFQQESGFDGNNNGIDDAEESSGKIRGGGSVNPSYLWLLLFVLFRRYRLRRSVKLLHYILAVTLLGATQQSLGTTQFDNEHGDQYWYVGAGIGASRLSPEGESNNWLARDDHDTGYEAFIGKQLNASWSAELRHADLGQARVENRIAATNDMFPNAAIGYRSTSLTGNLSLSRTDLVNRNLSWNPYLRLGVSFIEIQRKNVNQSLGLDKSKTFEPVLGIGIQTSKKDSPWRTELAITTFGENAQLASFSLIRQLSSRSISYGKSATKSANNEITTDPKTHLTDDIQRQETKLTRRNQTKLLSTNCETTKFARHVYFSFDDYQLSNEAIADLQTFIMQWENTIRKNSLIKIVAEGHTDSFGSHLYNDQLSLKRANAVINHLLENSTASREQILAVAKGENAPLYSNTSNSGRAKNRRVTLSIVSNDLCD